MLLAMQHREALRDRNKERKEKRRRSKPKFGAGELPQFTMPQALPHAYRPPPAPVGAAGAGRAALAPGGGGPRPEVTLLCAAWHVAGLSPPRSEGEGGSPEKAGGGFA